MFDEPSPMHEHDLNRFWNELVRPTGDPETDGTLDSATGETVRHIQDLGASSPPVSSRERVRRVVRANVEARVNKELTRNLPGFLEITDPVAKPNGRHEPPAVATPRHRFPVERRRWLVAQFATAALLVVTLLAIYVAFLHNRPADSPATPIETTPFDVPFYRGNPARTGEMPGVGPNAQPSVRWQLDLGAEIRSAPAVVGGVLYVGTLDGNVYALSAATGAVRWTVPTGAPVSSSPAVVAGLLYVCTDAGTLLALAVDDGAERWRFQGCHQGSSPLVVDGTVYLGDAGGTLHALDADEGDQRWTFATSGALARSPAFADGTVYAGSADGSLYAVDAVTGHERWRFRTEGGTLDTPVATGGVVYQVTFGGPADRLYVLDAATGRERWRFAVGKSLTTPAVIRGMVVCGSGDGGVYAIDAITGTLRWRFATTGAIGAPPVVVDDVVYVAGQDAYLYAVDAARGTEHWRFPLADAVVADPVITGGIVFVGTRDGTLSALGVDTVT